VLAELKLEFGYPVNPQDEYMKNRIDEREKVTLFHLLKFYILKHLIHKTCLIILINEFISFWSFNFLVGVITNPYFET
jgi:hypothetical protein